jgi:curli biogenesis system outer membrane secretion channel CsgG
MGSLRTAALGLTVLAVGCATGGATLQQFNPQGETLKTIALISVPNPVQYTAVDYGGKAGLFGAIGGAAIAADAKTMSETLTKTASDARFDYGREMQAALVDRLKRAGFKVVMVRAEREAPHALVADYAKVPSGEADALLDVDARIVGYATYNITDPDFRPYVSADVRLVSARTRAVLYSEQIMFGYHNPFMSATQLPSDKKYYFKDFNALMADKPRALEGMREGTKVIADHVAQRLTTK